MRNKLQFMILVGLCFFVRSVNSQITFQDVSSSAGISGSYTTSSVGFNDLDNDNHPDIFQTYENGTKLYRNNNDGTFTSYSNIALMYGIICGSQAADMDNDGDLDMAIGGYYGASTNLKIYRNDGSLIFTDITAGAVGSITSQIFSLAWLDYDNDGYADLFLGGVGPDSVKLFRNNGNNTFSERTYQTGLVFKVNSRGLASGDYDNDGDMDIYIASMNSNCLFLRNDNGVFTNVTVSVGLSGIYGSVYCPVFADYDYDGDLDLLVGMDNYPFRLFRNDNGSFTEVTNAAGLYMGSGAPRGAQFADFDNDGDLDLAMQVHITDKRIAIYKNNGNGTFTDITASANLIHTPGETANMLTVADYDRDGRLDMYDGEHSRAAYLYKNTTVNDKHWLGLRLVGIQSNRSAIGAKIRLKTSTGWQYREISASNGYNGQIDYVQHFGLDNVTTIDSMIISWPSGIKHYYTNFSQIDTTVILFEIDLSDPKPVSNIVPYSDFTTSSSVTLTWTDPIEFYNLNPLDTFVIDIYREGVLKASVPKGTETYTENGLIDGQYCIYSLVTRHIPTDSTSDIVLSDGWYAGGHPVPSKPTNLRAVGYVNLACLTWNNPKTQQDGTPLDDLSKIFIYRNNILIDSVDQSIFADTVYYDHLPLMEMNYVYKVCAVDNEMPANLSEFSNESIAPAAIMISDTVLTHILVYGDTDSSFFWIYNNGLSDLEFDIKERKNVFTFLKERIQIDDTGTMERNNDISSSAGNVISAERAPISVRSSTITSQSGLTAMLSAGDYNAFGSDAVGGNFIKFDLTAPQYTYTIGSQSGLFIDGASFSKDGSILYAIERNGTPRFGRIDTATGIFTQIAVLPSGGWTDMTVDPTDGTIYAAFVDGSGNSFLYSISETGTPTLKGAVNGAVILIGLAADRYGNLYGYDVGGDNFFSINKSNGSATLIGSIGFDANYAQSLEFDLNENICYMAAYNNSNGEAELRTVNLSSGATTLIGKIGTGYNVEICGLGIASTGLPWVDVRPSTGVVQTGDSVKITVVWKGNVMEKTIVPYDGYLSILSNDPLMPAQKVRLHLDVTIDVKDMSGIPVNYELHNNYPNPFNPTTTIRYDLRDAGRVTLKIYNILGQEVRSLINRYEASGFKSVVWDGKDNAGNSVSSGLYIYRLEAGKFVRSRKMMMLK